MRRDYYYLASGERVIRISADKKPNASNRSTNGTWVVKEFDGVSWRIPTFPEITWGTLSKLTYIGSIKHPRGGIHE